MSTVNKREPGVAKYTVAPCVMCGEEVVVKFFYSESEKVRRAKAKKALCGKCWKAQNNAKAAEYNRRRGYARLYGTPKQIEWAEKIRKENISKVVKALKEQGHNEFAKRAEAYLGRQESAKFWINYQDYSRIEAIIQEKINNVIAAKEVMV